MNASSPPPWVASVYGQSAAQRAQSALQASQVHVQHHTVSQEARAALHASRIPQQQAAHPKHTAAYPGFQQPAPPQHPHPSFSGGYHGAPAQQVLQHSPAQQYSQHQVPQVFHKARPSQPPQQSQASNGVDIAAALRDQLLTRPDLIQALESTAQLPGDASASSQPVASDDAEDLAAALRAQLLDRPELIHALEASAAMPQQEESVADNAPADGDAEAAVKDGAAHDSGTSGSDRRDDTSHGVKLENNAEESADAAAKLAAVEDASADVHESAPEQSVVADGEAGSSTADIGVGKDIAEASADDLKSLSPKQASEGAEQAEGAEQLDHAERKQELGSAPQDRSMADVSEGVVTEGLYGNEPSDAGCVGDAEQDPSPARTSFPEAEVTTCPDNTPARPVTSLQPSAPVLPSKLLSTAAGPDAAGPVAADPGPSGRDAVVRGQPSAEEHPMLDRTSPRSIQFSKEALEAAGLAARSAQGPPEAVVEAAAHAALEVMVKSSDQQGLRDLPVTVVASALAASARGESFEYVPADYDDPTPQASRQAPLPHACSDGAVSCGAAASGEVDKDSEVGDTHAHGVCFGASGVPEMPDSFGHFDMGLRYAVPSGDAGPNALVFRYDVSPDDSADAVFASLRRRCEIELDDGCVVQMTMQVIRRPG